MAVFILVLLILEDILFITLLLCVNNHQCPCCHVTTVLVLLYFYQRSAKLGLPFKALQSHIGKYLVVSTLITN